jgi:hypothetical protein
VRNKEWLSERESVKSGQEGQSTGREHKGGQVEEEGDGGRKREEGEKGGGRGGREGKGREVIILVQFGGGHHGLSEITHNLFRVAALENCFFLANRVSLQPQVLQRTRQERLRPLMKTLKFQKITKSPPRESPRKSGRRNPKAKILKQERTKVSGNSEILFIEIFKLSKSDI